MSLVCKFWMAASTLAVVACTPPEPPPPRPPAPKPSAEPAEAEDPQARHAARKDGLTGGQLVFSDSFDRSDVGSDWTVRHAGEWLIEAGELKAVRVAEEEVRNQGVWLNRPLPDKVRVTFKARALSKVGDTKCEIFGTESKHESGYSIIFGGWNNSINTITRKGEHEPRRVVQSPHRPVENGKTYTWTVVRTDHVVRWYVDGTFMIAYDDNDPVRGNAFGFNNWATDVRFDDVQVFAL
jgi:hypothetical protein